jgi:PAS domain S-box-containing protein
MALEPSRPSVPLAVVVNDDPTQLKVLSGLVRKAGLEPRAFVGVEAALAFMNSIGQPGIIITDLYMPNVDGWRFCRLLRSPEYAAFNEVPILVVSATFSGDEPERIAADLGVEAFCPSPVDGRHFVQLVVSILNGRQANLRPRLLLVEDDRELSGILKQALESHGYEVDIALAYREASLVFRQNAYDVAVLDYHLPDGRGDALLDAFRAQRSDCVCLMMTTDPGPGLALDWMKRGATACLRKPFEPEYLIELCARARRERSLLRVQDLLEVRTRELRKSEANLREAQEIARLGRWELDLATGCLLWSDGIFALFEVDCGTFTPSYEVFLEFVHPDDRALVDRTYRDSVRSKTPYQIEHRLLLKDGRVKWVSEIGRTEYDDEGGSIRSVGTVQDITERKAAETANRETEELFKAFMENLPAYAFMKDQDGRYIFANKAFQSLGGVDPDERLGRTDQEVFSQAVAEKLMENDHLVRFSGQPVEVLEQAWYRGRMQTHLVSKFPIKRNDGTVVLGGIALDVSDRRDAEEALRESQNNLAAIINASPESAFLIDACGSVLICNTVSAKRLGLTPADIVGRCIYDFLPPEIATARRKYVAQVVRTGESLEFEDARDGRFFSHYLYPVLDRDGRVHRLAVFGHDITAYRIAEETLKKQKGLLSSIRQTQELFISGHDHRQVYRDMLQILVQVTDSAYGFLDEVRFDSQGTPYKSSLALSDISWDAESRRLYEQLAERKLEFRNLDNLAGAPAVEGRTIIANEAQRHIRYRGLPLGHPSIDCYMGIPLSFGNEIIGVAGVANRPGGYSDEIAEFIKPLTQACAAMIWAGRVVRRDAENLAALKASEEKYRRIAETANEGIWAMDEQYRTTYVNQRMAEMLGYRPEEMLGRRVDSYMFPVDLADHQEKMDFRRKGQGSVYERRFRHKDGREVWANVSATTLLDARGDFAGSFAMFTDITERRQAVEALRLLAESSYGSGEDVFRSLVRQIALSQGVRHVLLSRVEPHNPGSAHIIAVWSGGELAENFDYSLEGTPGQKVVTQGVCFYPRDVKGEFPSDALLKGMNAESYWGTPLRDSTGRTIGILALLDARPMEERSLALTLLHSFAVRASVELERKQAEEALRESEEKYRLIFEHSPLGLLCFDDEGVIVACNDNFVEIVGSSREVLIGLNMLSLSDKDMVAAIEKALKGSAGLYENVYHSVTARKETPIRALFAPMVVQKGLRRGGVGIIEDTTERDEAEKEKARLQSQLQQAQKMEAVGTLAGGIAHDFNNLLQAINGYTQYLLLDKTEQDYEYENLKAIQKAGDRAAELIRQLLLFSRKAAPNRQPVDMNQEVEQARRMLERTIPKMIDIDILLGSGLWSVNADAGQMEQTLLNLGTNAADAMPEGGKLHIETKNVTLDDEYARTHSGARPGRYVLLTFSDTGHGMDKQTIEHIFEPFFTTKEFGKGTGLGLASVYGIVKNHSGYIDCYSDVGYGTTFNIYLPALEQTETDAVSSKVARPPEGGTETILLVDDEEIIRDLASQVLGKFGYTVLAVSNGEKALELYSSRPDNIDMVIMDIGMPGMGGHRCFKELIQIDPKVKVLIASGYAIDGQVEKTLEDGAAGYVAKPYQVTDLLNRVRMILDGQR